MYETDQEQIEAIKNWWNENANWVIGGFLAFILSFAGWTWFQNSQQAQRVEASRLYDQLILNVSNSAADLEQRAEMIEQLKSGYSGMGYAVMAALIEAKDAVEVNDYAAAMSALQWAEDNADDTLLPVIKYRQALVLYAQNELDAAIVALDSIQSEGHQALTMELKGDILLEQGNVDAAREAYQAAVDASAEQGINSPFLTIKLNDLAQAE